MGEGVFPELVVAMAYVGLICADCAAPSVHDRYHVRRTATDKEHCPKCGSTFLVDPHEVDDDGLDANGHSAYDRMMIAQGWSIMQHIHVPSTGEASAEGDRMTTYMPRRPITKW